MPLPSDRTIGRGVPIEPSVADGRARPVFVSAHSCIVSSNVLRTHCGFFRVPR